MNTAVQLYRQNFPDDQRSDDEITLDLGQKYPDLIQSIPNAAADYDRIQQQISDANKPSPLDYAKQAAGSVIRGAVNTVADVPKAIAVGGRGLDRYVKNKTGVDISLGESDNPADSALYKAGQGLESLGEKVSPADVPSLDSSFWATKIPNTVGSLGAFVATGGVGKAMAEGAVKGVIKAVADDAADELIQSGTKEAAAKTLATEFANSVVRKSMAYHLAEATPAAIMGGADQAVGAYQEALNKTNDPDKAFKAYLANLPIGAAMAFPAGRLIPGGETGSTLARVIKDTLVGGATMTGQQIAGNLVAQQTYDPNRSAMEGVGETAGAGGIVTAALSALSHGMLGDKESASAGGKEKPTPPTPPIRQVPEPEINPLINYPSIAPELKAKVDDVIQRQAAGETGPAMETALNTIYAEPQMHRYYTEATSNGAKSVQPTAPAPTAPANTPGWVADEMRAYAEPLEKNGTADKIEELSAQGKTAKDIARELGLDVIQVRSVRNLRGIPALDEPVAFQDWLAKRNQAISPTATGATETPEANAPQSSAIAPTTNRDLSTEVSEPAAASDRLNEVRRMAAGAGQESKPEMPDLTRQRLAALATKQPYELSQEDFIALRQKQLADIGKSVPVETLIKAHEKLVNQAVQDGKDVPQRVLKEYPTISAAGSGTETGKQPQSTATANSQAAPASASPAVPTEAKQPAPPAADKAAADMAQGKTPPVPAAEPWEKITGSADDVVEKTAFKEAKVATTEGGKGRKSAQAYVETSDPEELYKDASADKNDRNSSRKLGVFESPDGSHVVVGTAYENGKGDAARKVTFFDHDGYHESIQFKKLLASGYRLIASIKTSEPTKAYVVTYSPHEWSKAQTELRARAAEVKQGGVAPVNEAVAQEMVGGGEERPQAASVVSSPNAPVEEWRRPGSGKIEPQLADKLMTAIGEPKWESAEEAREQIMGALGDLSMQDAQAILKAVSPVDRRSGQQDLMTGAEALQEKVYEAFEKTKDPQAVAREIAGIQGGATDATGKGAATSVAGQAATRPSTTEPERVVGRPNAAGVSGGESAGSGAQPGTAAAANGPVRFSERPNAPGAARTAYLKGQWDSVLSTAAENGIRLTVLQGLHEGGEWQRRAVTLTVADAAKPTADNVTLAIHELAGHPVFDSLTDTQKQMMYRAFEKAARPEGFIPKVSEKQGNISDITSEETLVERASRQLQAEGFDPAKASGIAQQVVRFLKGVYLRACLAIQSGLMGDGHVSPELAQEYFENRMRQYLAGDVSPMSFITFLGGAKPSVEQRGEFFKPVGGNGAASSFDMADGKMGYREVLPETMAALTYNHDIALADVRYSDRGEAPNLATVKTYDPHVISRDLNSTAKVEEDIAAYNELHDMHMAAFKVFDSANPGKLSFEQFLDTFTNADTPATEKVQLRNADLVANQLPPADPTLRPMDLTSEASQMQATDKAYRYGVSLRQDWSERRREAESFLKTADERLSRKNEQLAKLTQDYTNAELIFNQAKERSGELIKTLGESAKKLGNAGYKLGTLEQVIKNLEGTLSRPLLTQYDKALNRLYRTLSTNTDEAMKFTDMLERVAQLGVDWDGDSATNIKDAIKMVAKGDLLLEPFMQGTSESKALLALAVAFGKSDAHVMDLLEMRRSTAVDERQVVNKAISMAMQNNADAVTEARKLVRNLPKLGKTADHLLQRLQQIKDENRALLDDNARHRAFIDFHTRALPVLQSHMTQLEHVLGVRAPSWEANDKAEYFVAPNPKATPEQVEASKATLKLSDVTSNDAVLRHIEQNNAWLNAQPADQRGALWNTVKEMTTKLENAVGVATHELVIKKSFINNYLGSIIDKLESVGLPSLRNAAQRFRRYQAERYASNAEADANGSAWAGAEARAMKALGFERAGMDTFERLFYQGAHSFAEKNSDHWAAYKDPKQAFEAFLPKLRDYFLRSDDPDTRERMQRPGAWNALEALYRADYNSSDALNKFRSKLGVKIQEQMPDGSLIEREPIGVNFGTALRRARASTGRMYQAMRDMGWLGTKQDKAFDAGTIAEEYAQDPGALDERLQGYVNSDVERDFIKPLVYGMDGRSAFYAPVGEDGITKVALAENVKKAYDASQGSLVQFANNLFDLETANDGTLESEPEYIGKTIAQFKEFFDSLHSQFKDMDDNARHGLPTPPRMFQDARVSESWPGAWLEYQTYNRFDTHRLYEHLAAQAAFGRNLDGVRRDFQTGLNDLTSKVGTLSDIAARVQNEHRDAKGKKLDQLIRAEVQRRGYNYTDLSQAARTLTMVRSEQRNFESLMSIHGGLALELRPFMELVSAAAGATVQGPITALLHMPNLYAQFGKLGLGPASLAVMRRGISSTASEMAGTLAQMFHGQIGWNADRNARRVRNGIVDTDALRRFSDARTALLNDPTLASNRATRGLFTLARMVRLAMSSGIGKAKEGSENAYATFKPQALFTQTANHIDAGLIDGWTHGLEDHIERAINYFKNPDHADDFKNPAFKFTSLDQLGYSKGFLGIGSDERAFKYFTNALARYGIDFESHAKEVLRQRAGDSTVPALNDEQFRRMASLVQNEVTLESSIATRPSAFFTNPLWRMSAPLVGWSVAKSHDAWESWRNPDLTETANNPIRRLAIGALPYLALVPAGVAMGAMRNLMQTQLTGKRANREDPTSFAGALDSLAWVGTFGLGGDILNSVYNRDTQRPFDVDHRVFFVSSMHSAISALQNWYEQGSADYATVYRPLMQALGGNGALQYLDIANHALSLDNAEARVNARINVGNYLRVAGRELKMDVRVNDGGEVISNPLRPLVGQMVMAAYANNAHDFQDAYHQALAVATQEKGTRSEALDAVQRAFEARSPLRSVFRTPPTTQDVQRILAALPDEGKTAVNNALRMFSQYGAQVINGKGFGLKPDYGREVKATAALPITPVQLQEFRQRAMAL